MPTRLPLTTTTTPPPPVPIDLLRVEAVLDYVKLALPVHGGALFEPNPRYRWNAVSASDTFTLTVHDPTQADLRLVHDTLEGPPLVELELAVDFRVAGTVTPADRPAVLAETFRALAARFRPDESLLFGVGLKGGFSLPRGLKPVHGRFPGTEETVIYGHRGEGQQAKLYLKTHDQRQALPPEQHRVRLETRLKSFGLFELPFRTLADLGNEQLRKHLAKVFRIIDRPEVRRPSRHPPEKLRDLATEMHRLWCQAGVNAFGGPPLPPDSSAFAKKAASTRAAMGDIGSWADFKLRRDTVVNAVISDRIRSLQRRLATTFAGSSSTKITEPRA